MEIRFDGKRALVTGAGRGIGKGIAIKLAECGAEVIALSLIQSELEQLSKINAKIETLCVDVGNWEATKAALQNVGPIDLLVNNAGIIGSANMDQLTEKEIDELYNINVKAIINITKIISDGMKSRGQGGSIVNISSIYALRAASSRSLYSSSKAAVIQLTKNMAVEYGPHKIRVNAVNPTAIRTKMTAHLFEEKNCQILKELKERTPLRRLGEVEDVVDPILFLLSEKASLITGVTLPIDGGVTISF